MQPNDLGIRAQSDRFAGNATRQDLLRTAVLATDDWLNSADTCRACGVKSRMALWRWQRDPTVNFPPPISMNGRNYWRASDVARWKTEKAVAASAKSAEAGSGSK
jgi:predicted DNA-binding transcriptional regulator AlpA